MSLSDKYRQIASGLRHIASARMIVPGEMYGISGVFEDLVLAARDIENITINTGVLAVDFSLASRQIITLTQNTLISLNNLVINPNYLVILGAFAPTFSGVKWNNDIAPTPTATAGKADVYEFVKISDHIVGRALLQATTW
jgi:hypothetical protein